MSYKFVLDPDDGTAPVTLEFEPYKRLFVALVKAAPSYLAPLKRFRGPHAKLLVPADAMEFVLDEIQRIMKNVPDADNRKFLADLAGLVELGRSRGVGLRGVSP